MLEVRNLRVSYGAAPAVIDASLDVEAGGLVVVVGPNGAGKTTLINAIAGLHRPDAGTLRIAGASLEGVPSHRYCDHGIGLVPEGRRLFTGPPLPQPRLPPTPPPPPQPPPPPPHL